MWSRISPLALLAIAACSSAPRPPESLAARTPVTVEPVVPTMRMHVVDIGQGSATLLEFPEAAVLVDTGGEQNTHFDSNAKLDAYLDRFFAGRPDLHGELASLSLTHPHIDHTRGAPVVLAHQPPHNVVTNGQNVGSGAEFQNVLRKYAVDHQGSVGFREVHLDDVPPAELRAPQRRSAPPVHAPVYPHESVKRPASCGRP